MTNWQGGFRNPIIHGNTIIPGTVDSDALADGAVIEAKLADLAVAAAKLQDEAVTNAKLGDSSISTVKLQDLSVTTAKIGLLAVGNAQINDLSADKINAGVITALTYRTAASGERLEINGAASETFVSLFDSAGTEVGVMGYIPPLVSTMRFEGKNSTGIDLWSDLEVDISVSGSGGGHITLSPAGGGGKVIVSSDLDVTGHNLTVDEIRTEDAGSATDAVIGSKNDTDTGIGFGNTANQINFITGGTMRFRLQSDGNLDFNGNILYDIGSVRVSFGSAAAPTLTFNGDTNTGIYRYAADDIGFSLGGSKRFHMDFAGNGSRLYGSETNDWFEIDGTNEWYQFFLNNDEVFRVEDGGSSSHLKTRDGLTDVGNHETLRLNRGTGTTLQFIGYYSSWVKDPQTGETRKLEVVPLRSNKRSLAKHWQRPWFMDLEPIKYRRKQHSERYNSGKKGHGGKAKTKERRMQWDAPQIEIGFSIENLIEHTNLLTTKGSKVGGTPDEYALLAVTVDYVQYLQEQVDELRQRLDSLAGSATMDKAA